MINKLFIYYLRFRTIKLNFIEYIMLNLIEKLYEYQLYILYYIKLCFGEDIFDLPILNENNEYECIHIYNIISETSMIRLLWKWKYKGIDINDINTETMIFFYHNKKHYILYINITMNTYYFYDVGLKTTSCINDIEFGQIKLCV